MSDTPVEGVTETEGHIVDSTTRRAVPYSPVPTSTNVGIARMGDEVMVALEFQTPSGDQVYFYNGMDASRLASAIMKQARQAQVMESQSAKLVSANGEKLL